MDKQVTLPKIIPKFFTTIIEMVRSNAHTCNPA
jgi:hypothetical protein